jgi:hypothetical protein
VKSKMVALVFPPRLLLLWSNTSIVVPYNDTECRNAIDIVGNNCSSIRTHDRVEHNSCCGGSPSFHSCLVRTMGGGWWAMRSRSSMDILDRP